MNWEHSEYLYLLLLLPALLLPAFYHFWWKKRAARRLADVHLMPDLIPDLSRRAFWWKFVFFGFALAMLIVALANPRTEGETKEARQEGVDVVFALDVSRSMLCEDIQPNRLQKAKLIVSRSLEKMVSDRVSLVAYAGRAYPLAPMTTDYGSLSLFLGNADTELVPSQGTAISDAIAMGMEYLEDSPSEGGAIFVLSDGEDHEEGAEKMAREALEKGIQVYSIGVGTTRGGPIPLRSGNRTVYKKDRRGERVITRMDREQLEAIAREGGGKYIRGSRPAADVANEIWEVLRGLEQQEVESKVFTEYEDHFQWFLAAGLLFLLVEMSFAERKSIWTKRLEKWLGN